MRTDDKELIHQLLDGELGAEEQERLLRRVKADPELAREYEALSSPVRLLAADGRCEAPPDLAGSVMRRLPQPAPALSERLRAFFFGARVLRWNMATAMAGVLLVAAALVVTQYQEGGRTAPPAAVTEVPTTVRLSFYAPQARQVAVAGDFNRWTVGSDVMERRDGGVWTIDLTLQPGRYTYMFVLDGKSWVADPGAESYQDDGFGSRNSVMKVRT
jgi:negative regulator of sigma E activity